MYIRRPATGEVWLNNLDNANFALRAKNYFTHQRNILKKRKNALSASENAKRALARFFR
jgi:hypothetical protein